MLAAADAISVSEDKISSVISAPNVSSYPLGLT